MIFSLNVFFLILKTLSIQTFTWSYVSFCSPQVSMVDAIPGLIHAIRMIHTISRYYSISENIRSLFVKVTMFLYCNCCSIYNRCWFLPMQKCLQVTNQMITACKNYITNNGANSIWDQPQQVVVNKIKAAIHLNQVNDDSVLLFLQELLCLCT